MAYRGSSSESRDNSVASVAMAEGASPIVEEEGKGYIKSKRRKIMCITKWGKFGKKSSKVIINIVTVKSGKCCRCV